MDQPPPGVSWAGDNALLATEQKGMFTVKFAALIEFGPEPVDQMQVNAHQEYLRELKSRGKLWTAGPFADDSGVLLVYEADSEEEAERLIEDDPLSQAGAYASYGLKEWNQIL